MPIPGGQDIIEVVLRWLFNGQQLMNVVHYRADVGVVPHTLAGANNLADDAYNALTGDPNFLACFHASCFLDHCTAQVIAPTRFARGRSANVGGTAGTRVGTALPTSCQVSLTALTNNVGPAGHGGMRLAMGVVNDLLLSNWTAAFQTAIVLGVSTLYDSPPPFGANLVPIVYNKANYLNSNDVVSSVVEDQARTMRRRVVGRGI